MRRFECVCANVCRVHVQHALGVRRVSSKGGEVCRFNLLIDGLILLVDLVDWLITLVDLEGYLYIG